MRPTSWAAVAILAAVTVVGCQHKQPPAGPPIAPPATADTVRDIRASYQQTDPSAAVGLVIATLPESNLVAIGDVPVNQFQSGEVVTFIDSNQSVIAVGTVVNVTADAVHAKFQPQGESARAPREGDLAVKTKS